MTSPRDPLVNEPVDDQAEVKEPTPARSRGKTVGRVVGIAVIVAIVAAALLGVG
jgi:hypothetical protein